MFVFGVSFKMPPKSLYTLAIDAVVKNNLKVDKGSVPATVHKDIKVAQIGTLEPSWKTSKALVQPTFILYNVL